MYQVRLPFPPPSPPVPPRARIVRLLAAATALAALADGSQLQADEWKSGIQWPRPPVVTPAAQPGGPPSDAIVLFDGQDLAAWEGGERWKIADGYATAHGGDIRTHEAFGDCQLHLEFAAPAEVKGQGQNRGNSGVYLMGRYEVQLLDSFENNTYFDGQCGAIYKQQPPMVNVCLPPGQWQTLEILFTAPRFAQDGQLVSPASVSVLHNGVALHHHVQLQGATAWHKPPTYEPHPDRLPLTLQFHGNPVRFRNIWIRPLAPLVGQPPTPAEPAPAVPTSDSPP